MSQKLKVSITGDQLKKKVYLKLVFWKVSLKRKICNKEWKDHKTPLNGQVFTFFIIPESKKDKVNDKESLLNNLVKMIFPYLGKL